jgi:hypothetical protein
VTGSLPVICIYIARENRALFFFFSSSSSLSPCEIQLSLRGYSLHSAVLHTELVRMAHKSQQMLAEENRAGISWGSEVCRNEATVYWACT